MAVLVAAITGVAGSCGLGVGVADGDVAGVDMGRGPFGVFDGDWGGGVGGMGETAPRTGGSSSENRSIALRMSQVHQVSPRYSR